MSRTYQICNRCVMDTTDPEIVFDSNGNCNHCNSAIESLNKVYLKPHNEKEILLNELLANIKTAKGNNKYDCVIGLSGGVDSSYLAYLVKGWGLNPLAIHVDNGWNSELAVQNIENIVKKLDIDLYTFVLDWEEFRDLQLAFIKASVVDLEMLSDNAIVAGVYKYAKKFNVKYFLDGTNLSTESIMPRSWYFSFKLDGLNIKSIYKQHGNGRKLKTYPLLNFIDFLKSIKGKTLKQASPLNYVEYDKEKAKKLITKELAWQDYGGKHGESRITMFYQNYILPNKFNVDKRKAHLSSLICSGQLTREKALLELKKELYEPSKLSEDYDFFLKKLEFTDAEFKKIMAENPKEHLEYAGFVHWFKFLSKVKQFLKK